MMEERSGTGSRRCRMTLRSARGTRNVSTKRNLKSSGRKEALALSGTQTLLTGTSRMEVSIIVYPNASVTSYLNNC
jgi:hypothetical protein